MLEINLKKLIKSYDQNLLDNLRGFGKDDEFLKFWVPGTDDFQSFLNLLDALVETNIINFNLKIEFEDEESKLIENIDKTLSQISNFKKNIENDIISLEIQISKYRYKEYLTNNKKQEKQSKNQEIDKTKQVKILKIKESINPIYKKNIERINPKDYFNKNIENEKFYIQDIEGGKIALIIENQIIQKLYHNFYENSDLKKLINIFFEIIEKKNIKEAADHGTIYLEEKIRKIDNKIINNGIILPGQAGNYFTSINECIRKLLSDYELKNNIKFDTNKDYYKISTYWKKLSDDEKLIKIDQSLKKFVLSYNELSQDSLSVNKIENNFRIYLNVDKNFNRIQKNKNLLLDIEMELKKLDNTLEVFIEEILDQNKLRLKNSPQNL